MSFSAYREEETDLSLRQNLRSASEMLFNGERQQ
jgi:hypothetical protein